MKKGRHGASKCMMNFMRRFLALLPCLIISACATSRAPQEIISDPFAGAKDDHGLVMACSWYCAAPAIEATATSTLGGSNSTYAAENAHDFKAASVWVEGVDGYGIGEQLTFAFDYRARTGPSDDGGVNAVSIINGYAATSSLWRANSRVKELKVSFNGKEVARLKLKDMMKPQWFDLPRMPFERGKISEITFEIVSVYPGQKYKDTAIADIRFDGFGTSH